MTNLFLFTTLSFLSGQSPCGFPQEMIKDGFIEPKIQGKEIRLTANVEFWGNLINPDEWNLETKWVILGAKIPFVMGNYNFWTYMSNDAHISAPLPENLDLFIIGVDVRPVHKKLPQCRGQWQKLKGIQLYKPLLSEHKFE